MVCLLISRILALLLFYRTCQAQAPWPVTSHDSALTFSAPFTVEAFAAYCPSTLPIMYPYSSLLIPSPGLLVAAYASNYEITIQTYNTLTHSLTSNVTSGFESPSIIAVDATGSMRLYFTELDFAKKEHFKLSALPLTWNQVAWSVEIEAQYSELTRPISVTYNTFTDTLDVIWSKAPPTVARYAGANGVNLWSSAINVSSVPATASDFAIAAILSNGDELIASQTTSGAPFTWLCVLDSNAGKQKWNVLLNGTLTNALALPHTIIAWMSQATRPLVALHPHTGAVLWSKSTTDCTEAHSVSLAAVTNGSLIAVTCETSADIDIFYSADGSPFTVVSSSALAEGPVSIFSVGSLLFINRATFESASLANASAVVNSTLIYNVTLQYTVVDSDGTIFASDATSFSVKILANCASTRPPMESLRPSHAHFNWKVFTLVMCTVFGSIALLGLCIWAAAAIVKCFRRRVRYVRLRR